jgi:photosystem II stability/assembly factor-like uncharacterized protein
MIINRLALPTVFVLGVRNNMRLNLVRFLSLCVFSAISIAQAESLSYQAPLVTESLLLDLTSSEERLIAVGERGHILVSDDGTDWKQIPTPSTATLTSVYFVGENGWAVGHDATILGSKDKGESWSVLNFEPELERPFLDVLFLDNSHGIAIGAYGFFFRTTDSGITWQREMHPEFLHPDDQQYLEEIKLEDEAFYLEELVSILPHLNSISKSGERLLLAGESGLLAFSDDLGKNWQRMEINYLGSFFDIAETQSGRIFAAGLRGNLFELNKTNQQWQKIESGSSSSLNAVVSIDEEKSMILGNNGATVSISKEQATFKQHLDGKAIVNGLAFSGRLIAVSGTGIKHIDTEQ